MAKPPELIEEVLPAADAAVIAVVSKIVEQAPQPAYEKTLEKDVPSIAARQVVELKVSKVLFGAMKVGAVVKVTKPDGDYALREGNSGPFVLGQGKTGVEILGRYGPDTWREAAVAQAANKLGKR